MIHITKYYNGYYDCVVNNHTTLSVIPYTYITVKMCSLHLVHFELHLNLWDYLYKKVNIHI